MQGNKSYDISEGKKFRWMAIALSISLFLMGGKLMTYFITNSNAILSDAAESMVNIVAGSFALYSVWLAAKPRDREHPYGHGKIEFLSAGLEGFLIITAALAIIIKSSYKIFLNLKL